MRVYHTTSRDSNLTVKPRGMFDPRQDTIRPLYHRQPMGIILQQYPGNGSQHGYESNNFVGCSLIWIDSWEAPCFHGSKFHLREIYRYLSSWIWNERMNRSGYRNINNNRLLDGTVFDWLKKRWRISKINHFLLCKERFVKVIIIINYQFNLE